MSTYLGFDLSTQQLKILATNEDLEVLKEVNVHFDSDLPLYGTKGGSHIHDDKLTVTVPTAMWVEALDLALARMKQSGFDFSSVVGLSGTGQQHGSVYWKNGSEELLKTLKSDGTLHEQLKDSFSVTDSPIWMDSSTSADCRNLESIVGGKLKLAQITGSSGYERFTGNQIRKIFCSNKSAYDNTERISLVSSFVASLLLGEYAQIDFSDGSGMNLLDIRSKNWSEKCLLACGDETLADKLGKPVPSTAVLGKVSKYLVERYGFNPQCQVVAFTGDNPASLAGCRLQKGDVVVSLGTSDTLILWLDQSNPSIEGHVFVNPVDHQAYMGLLCFKNGSLTREKSRDEFAGGCWERFSQALRDTKPGNCGNVGFFFDSREIIPDAIGHFRFDADDNQVTSFAQPEVNIRSLIEGQFVSKRHHAAKLGYELGPESRVLATGGASNNPEILQVLSEVFEAPVYVMETTPNSACLGCAYRAKHGVKGGRFDEIFRDPPKYKLAARPSPDVKYDVTRYARLEQRAVHLSS